VSLLARSALKYKTSLWIMSDCFLLEQANSLEGMEYTQSQRIGLFIKQDIPQGKDKVFTVLN
jgi:hypothetical protein